MGLAERLGKTLILALSSPGKMQEKSYWKPPIVTIQTLAISRPCDGFDDRGSIEILRWCGGKMQFQVWTDATAESFMSLLDPNHHTHCDFLSYALGFVPCLKLRILGIKSQWFFPSRLTGWQMGFLGSPTCHQVGEHCSSWLSWWTLLEPQCSGECVSHFECQNTNGRTSYFPLMKRFVHTPPQTDLTLGHGSQRIWCCIDSWCFCIWLYFV